MKNQNNDNKIIDLTSDKRFKTGVIASVVCMVCNLLLAGAKIFVGFLVASVSMMADGVNNLADIAGGGASLVGFYFAQKPADKEHPFGHARFEYIAGLAISMLIMFLGITIFVESVKTIFSGSAENFSYLAIIVLFFGIAVKFALGVINLKISEKINSKTLKAVAIDSFSDCIATSGVIVGMLIYRWTNLSLDGVIGCVIAILIFYSGIKVAKEVLSSLLGEGVSSELESEIKTRILKRKDIVGLHDLIVHSYGAGKIFASCHVEMSEAHSAVACHDVIDEIEEELYALGINLVVHCDPVKLDSEGTNRLKKVVQQKLAEFGDGLEIHDFRCEETQKSTLLTFDLVVPFENDKEPDVICQLLSWEMEKFDPQIRLKIKGERTF